MTGGYQEKKPCILPCSAADSLPSCEAVLSALNMRLTLPTFKLRLILYTNLSITEQQSSLMRYTSASSVSFPLHGHR